MNIKDIQERSFKIEDKIREKHPVGPYIYYNDENG